MGLAHGRAGRYKRGELAVQNECAESSNEAAVRWCKMEVKDAQLAEEVLPAAWQRAGDHSRADMPTRQVPDGRQLRHCTCVRLHASFAQAL